jgi:hypothetical protein
VTYATRHRSQRPDLHEAMRRKCHCPKFANLVAVCTRHHHRMEAAGLTLIRRPGGTEHLVQYEDALREFQNAQPNSP